MNDDEGGEEEQSLGLVLGYFLVGWLKFLAVLIGTGIILELAYWASK